MRRTICLLILGGIAAIGCASAAEADSNAEIGIETSELLSCKPLGAPLDLWPSGKLYTALCSGVYCRSTCYAGESCSPWDCDLSYLPAECRVNPEQRINAGWPGISQSTCQGAQGACWDNTFPGVPWCFEQINRSPTCDPRFPNTRVNAGWPGITAEQCVNGQHACFDSSVKNVPWCYQKRPRAW